MSVSVSVRAASRLRLASVIEKDDCSRSSGARDRHETLGSHRLASPPTEKCEQCDISASAPPRVLLPLSYRRSCEVISGADRCAGEATWPCEPPPNWPSTPPPNFETSSSIKGGSPSRLVRKVSLPSAPAQLAQLYRSHALRRSPEPPIDAYEQLVGVGVQASGLAMQEE